MGLIFSNSYNNQKPGSKYAYHILRVQPNSPAEQAGLQPFFDFILAINGQYMTAEQQPHGMLMPKNWHSAISSERAVLATPTFINLSVYSSKVRQVRQVSVAIVTTTGSSDLSANNSWGGQGLLGISVRLCSHAGQPALAWRILDVAPGSPASLAGLHPGSDFIVGAAVCGGDEIVGIKEAASLNSHEDLFELIESRPPCSVLQLYVYCSSTDQFRQLTVTPDPDWGGDGVLGCGIGYGYLHQIPGCQDDNGLSSSSLAQHNNPSVSTGI